MAYVNSNAPGADEWCVLVDRVNDVFNYSLAHAAAHALSAQWPGSKVVKFPWPLDNPNQSPDPAQQYACVWLPKPGEDSPREDSDFLCISGVCRAGPWCDSEGLRLHEGLVVDPAPPLSEGEQSLHRMTASLAHWLPWMPDAPAFSGTVQPQSVVEEVVAWFENTISQLKPSHDWGSSPLWSVMERSIPLFAAPLDAGELEEATPKIAAGRHQRRI